MDAVASMCLAWKQNMHKCVGAHCWLRENAFCINFQSGVQGKKASGHTSERDVELPLPHVASRPSQYKILQASPMKPHEAVSF